MSHPLALALHTLHARPRLLFALLLGLAVGMILAPAVSQDTATRFLIGWNAGALTYLALMGHMIWTASPDTIRTRARREAESRVMMLALVVLAAIAGLVAIFAQLAQVKSMHGLVKAAHVGLAVLTIFTSWSFTHSMFALHYAHDYYAARTAQQSPGISFPGTSEPDYGDFMYCAFIIGTSGQTADVSFTGQAARRTALVHSVLAFFFNTTMLAMTVNIAASFL